MSLFVKIRNNDSTNKIKSLPESMNIISSLPKTQNTKGIPRYTRFAAVYTLEAAVIFPLLACFFVCILFFFRVMQVQIQVQGAVTEVGRIMAAAAVDKEQTGTELVSLAAAKALLLKELKDCEQVEHYVAGGSAGVSIIGSKLEGNYIDLRAVTTVRFPIRVFRKQNVRVQQRVKCRKWTGWNGVVQDDEGEEWVYVAETGTVYHLTKECSHLSLSIQTVETDSLEQLRNQNGGIYHECHLCADKNVSTKYRYITKQGDRYHYDLNCSGIKRTVLKIRLSEVGTRSPCSRCTGNR